MKHLVWIAAILVATTAFARLGETETECDQRYGKPISQSVPKDLGDKEKEYSKNGVSVTVIFLHAKAAHIVYKKTGLSDAEVSSLLEANGGGWNAGYGGGDYDCWQRAGGATAIYHHWRGHPEDHYTRSLGLSDGEYATESMKRYQEKEKAKVKNALAGF